MLKFSKDSYRFILALIATFLWIGGVEGNGIANSENAKYINGDYGMTSSQTCVRTPFGPPPNAGFDPDTLHLLTDGEIISAVLSGIWHFRRDGEVSISDGKVTEILNNKLSAGDVPIARGMCQQL